MKWFQAILFGLTLFGIYWLIVKLFFYRALTLPPIKVLLTMMVIDIGAVFVGWGAGSWIKTLFK